MRLTSAVNAQLKYGEREKKRGLKRIAVCSGGGSNVLCLWAWDSSLTGCFDKCLDDCLIFSTSHRHSALGVSRCFTSELWHIHSLLSHGLERGTAALYWFRIMSYFLFYFLYWILDDIFGLVTRLRSEWFLAVPKRPVWLGTMLRPMLRLMQWAFLALFLSLKRTEREPTNHFCKSYGQ
jgi:hypothetical protein